MSFTTRCPACGTTFKIVADQLKISEGWVRCGHCADVFDATLYLEPWTADAPSPADGPAAASPAAVSPAVPWPPLGAASDPAEDELVTMPPMLMAGEWPEESPVNTAADADFSAELHSFAASKAAADIPPAQGKPAHTDVPTPSTAAANAVAATGDAPAILDASQTVEPAVAEGEPVPGFVQQARRRAFWQSTGVRLSLTLAALLLGVLLAAQWALHERDRLVAWRPELRPLLEQACAPLGCRVSPVRHIDAVVIDSSALVHRLGNFHSFDLVLKNTSNMALALPALELTLTDTRDEVLSRRVFLPGEWPDAPEVLPAQGSLTVSFRLSLAVGESTPMAGYRALVFYP